MKKLLKPGFLIILFIALRQYYLNNDLILKDKAEHAKTWVKEHYKNLYIDGILGKETLCGTLKHSYSEPDKPVPAFHYLKGNSRMELLSAMATNVHEIAHALQSQNEHAL